MSRLPRPISPLTLTIDATDPNVVMDGLNEAILAVQEEALHGDHGILVTRNSHSSFTIEISPDVPYGITRDVWA